MAGPSQAIISEVGHLNFAIVSSKIPSHKPRHPPWAAATSVPSLLQNSTGKQSAVITKQTW